MIANYSGIILMHANKINVQHITMQSIAVYDANPHWQSSGINFGAGFSVITYIIN